MLVKQKARKPEYSANHNYVIEKKYSWFVLFDLSFMWKFHYDVTKYCSGNNIDSFMFLKPWLTLWTSASEQLQNLAKMNAYLKTWINIIFCKVHFKIVIILYLLKCWRFTWKYHFLFWVNESHADNIQF